MGTKDATSSGVPMGTGVLLQWKTGNGTGHGMVLSGVYTSTQTRSAAALVPPKVW